MNVIGIVGWKDSGKTTLVTKLIETLTGQGLAVSTVKHAHHDFDVDQPGRDSHRHRMAGAREVLVSSARRWALMHEHRGAPEPGLDELLPHLSAVDLVIVEGFKTAGHDRIEVVRGTPEMALLAETDPHIVAVASDRPRPGVSVPVLPLDDVSAIAAFIRTHCGLEVGS